MARIFIAANSMIIGGIENSLINFLNSIDLNRHTITLLLQEKNGKLLNRIPSKVNIVEYKPLVHKNILVRKIKNRLNFIKFIQSNKNKYDVSICYASYVYLPSIIVRKICKNNYMWVHTDYTKKYNDKDFRKFCDKYGYKKFKNLVFVSKNALDNYFLKIKNQKYIVCHNIIPYEEIQEKSKEIIEFKKDSKITFLNVSRHDEDAKKITRIIEAAQLLVNDNITNFAILLIGNGPDTALYKKMVENNKLEEYVKFINSTSNPFPYFKLADYFILTSDYEGGPLTIYESLILKLPVITTDVGDVREFVENHNGIIIEKNSEFLKKVMKEFILKKKHYEVDFDPLKFNKESLIVINDIIEMKNT